MKNKKNNWILCGIVLWYAIFVGSIFTLMSINIDNHHFAKATIWGLVFIIDLVITMIKIHKIEITDSRDKI